MTRWQRWMQKHEAFALIGLAGVNPRESKRARAWGLFFAYAVVIVAIALLLQWQLELLDEISVRNRYIINICIWSFFLFEMAILLALVKDRWRYLRQNWLLPVIILLGIPFLTRHIETVAILRGLRPLLALFILIPSLRLLVQFFIDGQLRTTLLAAAIIVVIFGLLVAGVDPNVKTAWDGIWWAAATVSTVGYGDVVPTSALGRLLGVGLIVMGLGIFVVITANFLALALKRQVTELRKEELDVMEILKAVTAVKSEQHENAKVIKKIMERLEKLEKLLKKNNAKH